MAELVLTLTLSVARELPTIGVKQSQGLVVPKESCSGLLLHRKTIGIVGMGNIGACVADIFRGAFDASVIAYDPYAPTDAWPATPHLRAKRLEDILGVCHVLTIHVPLTPETRGLISYDQLRRMKPTAILVNASRGGVVNEKDLERALGEGLIWGAGLDCHEQEPPTLEGYENLWQYRVASTPHVGATTLETVAATGIAAVQRLHDYLHKGNVNPVNSQ